MAGHRSIHRTLLVSLLLVSLPLVSLPLVSLLPCWSWSVLGAAPRFTDRDSAMELAKVLDKGVFRGSLISSAFVDSPQVGDYEIKVVLDNGAELNWNLEQIRLWSQDSSLTLSKNRVLIFPQEDTTEFGTLDKNLFTRTALRARVFAKRYKGSDILAGQAIHYAIHRFNLVELLELAPARDEHGYAYRYVLDLENGQREFLSYLDAWEALNAGGLMEAPGSEPVMAAPYRLTGLRTHPLQRIVENGTGEFAVEMTFDRAVELQPGHYPYRLYERKPQQGKMALDNRFVLEVTAPNAILPQQVGGIDALEYLYDIQALSDNRHQNRVLLRAMIAPEVLTAPPEVIVNGASVTLVFSKVEDQSVFDRKALKEAELRRKQEKLLAPSLTPEEVERRRLYRAHMETGVGQRDKARAQANPNDRFDILLAALSNFREAAIHASSDTELEEALRQRNDLAQRLPDLIVEHARRTLATSGTPERGRVLELVRTIRGMTRDPRQLKALLEVEQALGGS
jgi:hypothetical protein